MTIKAKLTANGVKPDLANVTGGTVTPGLTATGSSATDAYELSLDDFHLFTTVAGGTGCIFAQAYAPGDEVAIANAGANSLLVYPSASGTINGGSAGVAITILPKATVRFRTTDGLAWWAPTINGSNVAVPTRQVLTSGSSATYTTPMGCRQLRIRMVGGGGGGSGVSSAGAYVGGAQGGSTSFNSIVAIGGAGGGSSGGYLATSGTGSASFRAIGTAGDDPVGQGLSSGIPYTGAGGASAFGAGPGAVSNTGNGLNAQGNTGAGGSGAAFNSGATAQPGGGGQAGEYVELIINAPASTYSYTVGAGGAGGSSTETGGNGGSGIIIVDECY